MRRPVAKDRNSPPPLSCGRGETFPRHRPRADGVGQLPLGPRTYFMTLFMRRRRRRAKKRGLISIDGRGGEGRGGEESTRGEERRVLVPTNPQYTARSLSQSGRASNATMPKSPRNEAKNHETTPQSEPQLPEGDFSDVQNLLGGGERRKKDGGRTGE